MGHLFGDSPVGVHTLGMRHYSIRGLPCVKLSIGPRVQCHEVSQPCTLPSLLSKFNAPLPRQLRAETLSDTVLRRASKKSGFKYIIDLNQVWELHGASLSTIWISSSHVWIKPNLNQVGTANQRYMTERHVIYIKNWPKGYIMGCYFYEFLQIFRIMREFIVNDFREK